MRTKGISSQPTDTMAIIVGEVPKFAFLSVTQNELSYEEIKPLPLPKLLQLLRKKKYKAFLIDVSILNADNEEIADFLMTLKDATGVPIIVTASGYTVDNPLVEALMSAGFSQWVMAEDLSTMYVEMSKCIEGANNAIELAYEERRKKEEIKKNVAPGHRTIGFVGTSSQVGTTTQATQFAMYLKSLGYTVAYIEAGGQHHVETLPKLYTVDYMDKKEGYAQYKGLDMYYKPVLVTASIRMAYDVCVYDYGTLTADTLPLLVQCMGKVAVVGTKPWQYGDFLWCNNLISKEDVTYILPFAAKAEEEDWNKRVGAQVKYAALFPDMFEPAKKNKHIYKELCSLVALTDKKKKKEGK